MADVMSVRATESDAGLDESKGANFTNQGGDSRTERVTLDSTKQAETDDKAGQSKLIFGKYKTMEEAEKAFKGLESRIGTTSEKKDAPAKPLTVDPSKVDLSDLKDEFVKNGKLSDASYAKAQEKGLSKTDVDQYISAQKAIADKYVEDLSTVVGGREQLDKLFEWANQNLTQKQAKAINAALQSQDLDAATIALEGLNARYVAATGKDPELVSGEAKGSRAGVEPYGDTAEMVNDMSNPKYRTSEAFRKNVEARIAAGMGGSMSVRAI